MFLLPFYKEDTVDIEAKLRLEGAVLHIEYIINDPDNKIIFLDKSRNPKRLDKLWEQTCFEFFIKNKNAKNYYEFNYSNSGDYNTYYLEDYRKITQHFDFNLQIDFINNSNLKYLKTSIDLRRLNTIAIDYKNPVEINITAITFYKNNHNYFALHHEEKADFHKGWQAFDLSKI